MTFPYPYPTEKQVTEAIVYAHWQDDRMGEMYLNDLAAYFERMVDQYISVKNGELQAEELSETCKRLASISCEFADEVPKFYHNNASRYAAFLERGHAG